MLKAMSNNMPPASEEYSYEEGRKLPDGREVGQSNQEKQESEEIKD